MRGEVKVIPYTRLELFQLGDEILCDNFGQLVGKKNDLENNENLQILTIEKVRYQPGCLLIKFRELDRVEDVESYRNHAVYLPRDAVVEQDNLLVEDLIGYKTVLALKESQISESQISKQVYGKIDGYYEAGSEGLYRVVIEVSNEALAKVGHLRENRDFFIPVDRSTFHHIDRELREVEIADLDLYWW